MLPYNNTHSTGLQSNGILPEENHLPNPARHASGRYQGPTVRSVAASPRRAWTKSISCFGTQYGDFIQHFDISNILMTGHYNKL